MKLSILLPTLGEREYEFRRLCDSLNIQVDKHLFELIVVSQSNHQKIKNILEEFNFTHKHIQIDKRGLSHARNIGLKYVEGEYLLLSDDDAWYPDKVLEEIINSMDDLNSDIVMYKIFDPISNQFYKDYSKHSRKINNIQLLKKSSIEMCFNLDKIHKEAIYFNEDFGLGAKYRSGEENLLLKSLLQKKYKAVYIDKTIVYHLKKENLVIDECYIRDKYEVLKRILGVFPGYIYLNLLVIKHITTVSNYNSRLKLLLESLLIIYKKNN